MAGKANPGRAICSFWQGRVEIILRIAAVLLGSIPALISAAIALHEFNLIPSEVIGNETAFIQVEEARRHRSTSAPEESTESTILPIIGNVFSGNLTLAMAIPGVTVFVIVVAAISAVIQDTIILIRICNFSFINKHIKIFLIFSIIVGIFIMLDHLAGGVVSAYYATDSDGVGVGGEIYEEYPITAKALAATAAFCYLAVILYGFLVIWEIIFVAKNWNKKVTEYSRIG